MPARHLFGPGQEEEVNVAQPFVERHGIDPLGHYDPFESLYCRAEHRSQRVRFVPGKLGERLAVAASLDDQFAGIGILPSMVTDEPHAIVEHHTTGG